MRRCSLILLAAAAIGLAASQVASAADLLRKAPAQPPPPPPPWTWTGFYAGGHFGGGISRDDWNDTGTSFSFSHPETLAPLDVMVVTLSQDPPVGSHNSLGPLGGFQLGYNYQLANSPVVIGVEGEFSFADLKGDHQNSTSNAFVFDTSTPITGFPLAFVQTSGTFNAQETLSTRVRDIAAITARLGLVSGPQDRTLWYVKGGGAWVKNEFGQSFNASVNACNTGFLTPLPSLGGALGCGAANATGTASGDHTRWGWTVGTGVEWGLWTNLSAKIEYDYLNFGSTDVTLSGSGVLNTSPINIGGPFSYTKSVSVDQQIHVVKVGLNYRFWGGPSY